MFFDISLQIYQFITCWKTCFCFWFACSLNLPVKSIGTHSALSVGNGKERRYPIFLKIGERIKNLNSITTMLHFFLTCKFLQATCFATGRGFEYFFLKCFIHRRLRTGSPDPLPPNIIIAFLRFIFWGIMWNKMKFKPQTNISEKTAPHCMINIECFRNVRLRL